MIDARGRSCPEPVIMLKKAMASKGARYEITVDNRVSVENLTRFAQHSGYQVAVASQGEDFILTITK